MVRYRFVIFILTVVMIMPGLFSGLPLQTKNISALYAQTHTEKYLENLLQRDNKSIDEKRTDLQNRIDTAKKKYANWHKRVLYIEDLFHASSSASARLYFSDLYQHYERIVYYLNENQPSDPAQMIYWETAKQYFPLREILLYSGFPIGRYPLEKNDTAALNNFYALWRDCKFNIRIEVSSVFETPTPAAKDYVFSSNGTIFIREKPLYEVTKDDFKGIDAATLLIKGWEKPFSGNDLPEKEGFGASLYLFNIFRYGSEKEFNDSKGFLQQNACDAFKTNQEMKKAYYKILQKMFPDELGKTDVTKVNKKVAYIVNRSGINHYKNKEYNLAVKNFTQAIFLFQHPNFYYNRGLVFFRIKEYDKATEDLKTALATGHSETEKIKKVIEKVEKEARLK